MLALPLRIWARKAAANECAAPESAAVVLPAEELKG
jgi:hypothetical protein